MDSGDSGVTSPLLRVTAEISHHKQNPTSREDEKFSVSPSTASKDGRPNLFARKKILNPLYGHNPYTRSNYASSYISSQQNPKNNVSTFTQRVMSAKLLRTKQLQNQLAEAQMKLNEALHENKVLRTLQHRQDNVLKKYEGNQEQLPQLLKSHHEELRVLNEKYKQIRGNYRELESKMKQKDMELTNLREQYKHLLKLSRDKHLGEREKLTQRVEELESIVEQQKTKIMNLDKKMQIEEKNHRHQLNQEISKFKKAQSELNSALETINNLKATIEAKERYTSAPFPRFQQSAPSQARPSHVSLPAPPRVSIRQTQRLVHSDIALQHEDSETADSISINYCPGEGGSSSGDSENLSSREEGIEGIVGNRIGGGLLPGGIHITKEEFKERRALRKPVVVPEVETKLLPVRDRRKGSRGETGIPLKNGLDKDKRKKSLTRNGTELKKPEEKKLEENQQQSNENDGASRSESRLGKFAHLETEEDILFTQIEKEIESQTVTSKGDMKLEMDSEFDKLLEGTKLSDEAISEYFKRDFRAEISEIEKKFQDLDKASEKYMKFEGKLNGESSENAFLGESDSDEEDKVASDKILKQLNEIKIHNLKPKGAILGESEKANLLKALNNIDEAHKPPSQGNFRT